MTKGLLPLLRSAFYRRPKVSFVLTYGVANALPQLTTAVLALAYTTTFSSKWYGVYGILTALIAILGIIGELGLPQAILRNYYERHAEPEEARRYLASALMGSRILAAAALAVAGVVLYLLWPYLNAGSPKTVVALLAIAFFDRSSNALAIVCRAMEKPVDFAVGAVVQSLATLASAFVFVYLLRYGIYGVLLTALLGRVASWLFYSAVVRRRFLIGGGAFVWSDLRACLSFGLPLFVNRAAGWGRQLALRPVLLLAMSSLAAVGVFSFASSLAVVPTMLSTAIDLALAPLYFKRRTDGTHDFRARALKFGIVPLPER